MSKLRNLGIRLRFNPRFDKQEGLFREGLFSELINRAI